MCPIPPLIADLNLPHAKTAHSLLKIPIAINSDSFCHIKKQCELADLLRMAKCLIWDEAPMTHRHCFEAVDRTLQDIRDCALPFGGLCVVLGGDFRQVSASASM